MNRTITVVLFLAITLVCSVTCQPDSMLAPPGRPSEFRSPGQLRQYLKALNDYYAIVGRPRFGRSVDNLNFNQLFGQENDNDQLVRNMQEDCPGFRKLSSFYLVDLCSYV